MSDTVYFLKNELFLKDLFKNVQMHYNRIKYDVFWMMEDGICRIEKFPFYLLYIIMTMKDV